MSADLSKRLVPDELWRLVAPLLPSFAARPQGAGTAPRDQRAVFTAVVYVLTSGCAWRHRAVLDELGVRGEVDWTSAIVDAASVRAKRCPYGFRQAVAGVGGW
ncbi:transposase [Streptomyces incarnatus]|uniref:transposase n=1 Tax=Streptomyces incarnatus TaxID=665007 RepID=UPI001AD82B30|nr:transposase [Streptomyces incarnatus]